MLHHSNKNQCTTNDTVIFIHIFKCAGTAFINPVRHYLSKHPERGLSYNTNIHPTNPSFFYNLSRDERESIRFISGHLRDHRNFKFMLRISSTPTVCLTILRDPVERVISSYYYLKEEKCRNFPLHAVVNKFSLEEILSGKVWDKMTPQCAHSLFEILNDHQTRILSGTEHSFSNFSSGTLHPRDLALQLEHLNLAKQFCIDNLSYVGFQNSYYADWGLISNKFALGLPDEHFLMEKNRPNVTSLRPNVKELNLELLELIKNNNKLDQLLFNFLKEEQGYINSRQLVYMGDSNA